MTIQEKLFTCARPGLALLLSLLAVSCAEPSLEVNRDQTDYTRRRDERTRRMRIVTLSPDGATGEIALESNPDSQGLIALLAERCARPTPGASASITPACMSQLQAAVSADCVAQHLLQLGEAETPTPLTSLLGGGASVPPTTTGIIIPPQLPEARITLLEGAFHQAAKAVTTAGTALRHGVGQTQALRSGAACSGADLALPIAIATNDDTTDVGTLLAETMIAAVRTADLAVHEAVRHHVSLADAEISRTSSPIASSRLAWMDPDMSRSQAARLLVGGMKQGALFGFAGTAPVTGLPTPTDGVDGGFVEMAENFGAPEEGICPMEEPDEETEQAIHMLRASGMDPSLVTNLSVPVDAVISGGSDGVATDDSFGARAALLLGKDPAAMGAPDAVLSELGLHRDAFTRARAYLRHESRAFARDFTVEVAAGVPLLPTVGTDGSGAPISVPHVLPAFAAMLEPPTPAPALYYQSIARLNGFTPAGADLGDSFDVSSPQVFIPLHDAEAQQSLAHLIDYAAGTASDLMADNIDIDSLGVLPDGAAAVLARFSATSSERRPLSIDMCSGTTGGGTLITVSATRAGALRDAEGTEIRLSADDVELVRGASGLRCAVDGLVEGQPCDLDEYRVAGTMQGFHVGLEWTLSPRIYGAKDAALGFYFVPAGLSVDGSPNDLLYAVRRLRGVDSVPGDYASLGSHRLLDDGAGGLSSYCSKTPVIPDIAEDVDRVLASSTGSCVRAEVTCAGPRFTDRIPLENELTADSFEPESSWRFYLQLARDAADRADRLGELMLDSGQALDERAELVEDNLRQLCGHDINVGDAFWDLLEEPPGASCADGASCVDGYRCESDVCKRDIMAFINERADSDPEYAALRDCLGDDSQIPLIAAGSSQLCIWKLGHRTCAYPEGTTAANGYVDCPYYADGPEDTPCANAHLPPGVTTELVSHTLDLFESGNPHNDEPPVTGFDCNIIRRYRTTRDPVEQRALADQIAHEALFRREHMLQLAQRIGFHGTVGDFASITVDGHTWRQTGNPRSNVVVGEWPCGGADDAATCAYDARFPSEQQLPLFCASTTDCSSDGVSGGGDGRRARAYMNRRLGRAVLALRALTAAPMADLALPHRPQPYWSTVEADGERGSDYNSLDSWRWTFDGGESDSFQVLRTGLSIGVGDKVEYFTSEHDAAWDDHATFDREGQAYCVETDTVEDAWVWTAFSPEDGPTGGTAILVPCSQGGTTPHGGGKVDPYNHSGRYRSQAVIFRGLSNTNTDRAAGLSQEMWAGMGSGTDTVGPEASGTRGLIWRTLRGRPPAGATYFTDDPSSPGDIIAPLAIDPINVGCTIDHGGHAHWACDHMPSYSRFWEADEYNDLGLADDGISFAALLDGMELACEVNADDINNPNPLVTSSCSEWSAVDSSELGNLRQGQRIMACLAEEVRKRGERQLFQDFPSQVFDALSGRRSLEGERGAQIDQLAESLETLANFPQQLGTELDLAASDLRRARLALDRNEVNVALIRNERMSRDLDRATQCITASLDAIARSSDISGTFGRVANAASAIATCANSVAQIVLNAQRAGLEREISDIDTNSQLELITQSMTQRLSNMKTLAREAKKAALRVKSILASLESQRQSALSEVEDMLSTFGNDSAVSTVQRRRYNTRLARYRSAHEYAIRSAWLARRALEQRLGVSLSSLRDDMYLIDAPADWADDVCTLTGFDYQRISRDFTLPSGVDTYDQEYVGDYVTKLEAVFQSYSRDFPFVDGTDVAVISMRDDIVQARTASCEVSVNNLLSYSGDLGVSGDPRFVAPPGLGDESGGPVPPEDRERPPVWERVGCATPAPPLDPDAGVPLQTCVRTEPLLDPADAPMTPMPDVGSEHGFRVVFGGAETLLTEDTAIRQRLWLDAGSYRLSWYGRLDATAAAEGRTELDPSSAVAVRNEAGAEIGTLGPVESPEIFWPRYSRLFNLDHGQTIDVVIKTHGVVEAQSVDLAAFMLEDVTSSLGADLTVLEPGPEFFRPLPYIGTDDPGVARMPVCEDPTGGAFRQRWHRGCTRRCPAGLGTCDDGIPACYWELSFDLSLDDMELGRRLARSGLAIGNYNYRWDSVAVNLVGTELRDCASSAYPSTCYGAAYVPFSLYHEDGFVVRNHRGEVYEAPIFPGRIEHARTLAAERYLTNPLSSADRALLQDYQRLELRGRPLAGSYALRLWDDSGFRFDRLEDIQLLMGYRYWTRLD